MEKLTSEQKIEKIIHRIAKKENIDRASARTQLHKFVCRGKCDWYKTKSKEAGFDRHDLTEQQIENIEEIVSQVMEGVTKDEVVIQRNKVLCH